MDERSSKSPADDVPVPDPAGKRHVHEDVRYDSTQVSIIGVTIVLIGIAVMFVIAILVARWFVHAQMSRNSSRGPGRASYSRPSGKLPPEPRLEQLGSNANELPENVFARQLLMERILHSYGRTSDGSFVRIPIEEAIRFAVPTIPARKASPGELDRSFGLVGGGDSSSGRKFQEAPSWFAPAK